MKIIRYLAALLLFITGVLHLLPLFSPPLTTEAIGTLIVGVIYPTIGVLLLLKPKIGTILGIIFPLIGLVMGFIVVGIKNWDTMLSIMFVIDAMVIICCVLLLAKRNKT